MKTERVGMGMLVDARDTQERWCEAKIVDLDAKKREVFVHYVGWNTRYDAWLPVKFLAAHGSHTGMSFMYATLIKHCGENGYLTWNL